MWFSKFKWPELSFDELKKRTRILVIDDSDFEYAKLFKNDLYSIDKWDDVTNIRDLEKGSYDIILLDIHGVGREYSKEDQGFAVLKYLKNVNPAQIIIAYSNDDYKLNYQEFFNLANDVIGKSQDFYIFKEVIDKNIKVRFSYDYYYNLIANKVGAGFDKQLKNSINNSIKKNNTKILENLLNKFDLSQEKISFALNILSFAMTTYSTLVGIGGQQ